MAWRGCPWTFVFHLRSVPKWLGKYHSGGRREEGERSGGKRRDAAGEDDFNPRRVTKGQMSLINRAATLLDAVLLCDRMWSSSTHPTTVFPRHGGFRGSVPCGR
ncbi:hypothetical protein BHM03_00017754 [Ensete ventricosum]|nr:hypothetical protein BHM03_00017754 [Ensete ventricosum]